MAIYWVIYRSKTGEMRELKRYGYAAAMHRYFLLISRGYADVSVQKG